MIFKRNYFLMYLKNPKLFNLFNDMNLKPFLFENITSSTI